MIITDFHIHTKYSGDSNLDPKEILKKAKKENFDVLGIVDHNSTEGAIRTKKLAKDILVLVGQEIKTEQGEIIVFGTEENLRGSFYEIIDAARERDLFIIIPHPFDKYRRAAGNFLSKGEIKSLLKKIDAIEIFNSRCFLDKFNKEAQKFSEENQLPGVAGSDAHVISEIGNAKNFLNCEKNEEEIYKAIKKGKLTWVGNKTSYINYLKKFFKK